MPPEEEAEGKNEVGEGGGVGVENKRKNETTKGWCGAFQTLKGTYHCCLLPLWRKTEKEKRLTCKNESDRNCPKKGGPV